MNRRVLVIGVVGVVAVLAAIAGVVVLASPRRNSSPRQTADVSPLQASPRQAPQSSQPAQWPAAVVDAQTPMTSNISASPFAVTPFAVTTPSAQTLKTKQPKTKTKTPTPPKITPKKTKITPKKTKNPMPAPSPSPSSSSPAVVTAQATAGKCQVSLANFPKGTVSKIPDSKRMRVDGGVAAVTCNPGEYASRGGVLLRFPSVCKGSREVTLTYDVKFGSDSSFDFVKGGKIGWGVQFGQGEIQGGKWASTAASARVMFRAGGAATAYLYYGKSGDPNDLSDQVPEYKDVAQSTGTAGHSLWQVGKSKNPHVLFKSGVWQTVSLYCKMNSPGQHDGVIALTIDGVTRRFDKLRWLNNPAGVDNLEFCTWYGGSGPDWSPKAPETFYFRNAKVAAN